MTQAKVEAVNKLLLAGEPGNISTDEHSGYTGYRPQAIIDAMNAEFWGIWGFEEISSEIVPTGDKGGSLAVAQVKVWLKDVESKPVGWGQNRVTRGDIGDARKGAQTDAIKKALSYFSIGNRAYQGLLKEDAGKNGHQPSKHTTTAKPVTQPQPELKNGDGTPVATKPADQQATALTLNQLKTLANQMGLAATQEEWRALVKSMYGREMPDLELKDSPSQRAILHGELLKRGNAATSGK